jgi:hypothetical protein
MARTTYAGQTPARSARFRVGDRVQFDILSGPVIATVTEDRGRIGMRGRRLYRVEGRDGDAVWVIELPEEELRPADASI